MKLVGSLCCRCMIDKNDCMYPKMFLFVVPYEVLYNSCCENIFVHCTVGEARFISTS